MGGIKKESEKKKVPLEELAQYSTSESAQSPVRKKGHGVKERVDPSGEREEACELSEVANILCLSVLECEECVDFTHTHTYTHRRVQHPPALLP